MPLEDSITLSRAQLVQLVQGLAGIAGYPNPEDPHEPGPWDPVLQNAFLNRLDLALAGPQPDPWKSINWALLNPQPLPPRYLWAQIAAGAIVSDIKTRMALMQSLPEEFHGPIAEGIQVNLSRFVDDVCGSEPWRWPFPPPRPWPSEPDPDPREMYVNPLDLIIMGVVFDNLAGTVSDELQGPLHDAAAAIQNAGLERL